MTAADLPARDAASAIAAVLAVTPIHPEHHDALIGWRKDEYRDEYWPIYGDPTPIAARQAAAALRWAANTEEACDQFGGCRCGNRLERLADEIDGGTADGE